ncbi:MAG: permease [Bacillota bacterium]|nr:permease [Bacillota bacterium]
MEKKKSIKKVFFKSVKGMSNALPMMFGIVFLIGLVKSFISFERIASIFTQNAFIDTTLGALVGSILAGNSISSYIIGNEMLNSGVSLFAVTSFLVAWVTVGFVQIPAEKETFGIKFALARNGLSIFLAIIISLVTVWTLGVIN